MKHRFQLLSKSAFAVMAADRKGRRELQAQLVKGRKLREQQVAEFNRKLAEFDRLLADIEAALGKVSV